ncbi:MAG: transposase family protein [Acidobacteria bacterium]|nr:transposase family protein [Acidobacteriota bacterium]
MISDSFETPVRRPSLHERQQRFSSGTQKRHTLKTQLATDHRGGLFCVGKAHRGPKADIRVAEERLICVFLAARLAALESGGDRLAHS